jgi:hypothetical protein
VKLKCRGCKKALEAGDPAGPTPNGVVQVECPHCHAVTDADNPHGDESFVFAEETWLRPTYGKVEGARARDGSGPSKVAVITGYELAEAGEEGARQFAAGTAIQRRLAPKELLEVKR